MSEKFVIRGGIPLRGTVDVSGAKNAAVAILPATLLCEGVCIIENLPMIDDVFILLKILEHLGAKVKLNKNRGRATIDTSKITSDTVTINLAKRLRASYYLVGALLGRFHRGIVPLPGGCAIGQRPIDMHIKGMRQLGADARTEHDTFIAEADRLVGRDIYLDQASVGTTINLMLAAARAEGQTTIVNAAKEPHVVDTANFLNCMGARIKGAGTDIIKIRGVEKMHGCSYGVIPDQIEAGTLMIAAAATRGDVTVQNIIPTHMDALTAKLLEMGVTVEEGDESIRVACERRPHRVSIKTLPYPGFPTDLQQPITVLLSTAEGTSVITESIFESRFKHIKEIRRMGANVTINDRIAVVEGVDRLTGASVSASDLRAGAALIVAGLMADGVTNIYNIEYIDRGYDHIENKLIALGADIQRREVEKEDFSMDIQSILED